MNDYLNKCHFGDCIETLRGMPDGIVQTCVTSPPYFGLRAYLADGHEDKCREIGLESTPDAYVAKLVDVFREVRRVMRDDATLWINLGDSYASSTKGSGGGAESSGLQRDGRREAVRLAGAERANDRARFEPRRFDIGELKPKDLIGIPWRVAFALQSDGWWLRQDIIWAKPNSMPESVTDRCTKAHEYIFLLAKSERYYYDHEAVKEPVAQGNEGATLGLYSRRAEGMGVGASGNEARSIKDQPLRPENRNKRSVWTVASEPYSGAHFATFPRKLIEPCILSGAPVGGVVLDPFLGSGTTAQVAQALGRQWIGCELNLAYEQMQLERVAQTSFLLEAA